VYVVKQMGMIVYQWLLARAPGETYEKGKDESRENGKDGPNTESVGEGRDPRAGIIVPEIVEVGVPEI
jgi:hypothetical protein